MNNLVSKTKSRLAIGGALLASLFVAPLTANAAPFGGGSGTTNNIAITSDFNWTTLGTVTVPADAATRRCQVVGSLDALNPGGVAGAQTYLFTVTLNDSNPATDGRAERQVELRNQATVNDPDSWPVTTNESFLALPNQTHTIRLLGRKVPGAPNLTVSDSTLSVSCI